MKIGIIDADLLGRKRHRFPNLALEKISGYCKDQGNDVTLLDNYMFIPDYDKVFIGKVFTDTEVPGYVLNYKNVTIGGTGFYFDRAIPLPHDIEHHMPDYHLYDGCAAIAERDRKEYDRPSIGYLTRGCFRKCPFCVNQSYSESVRWSNLKEFLDTEREDLVFLDDNFFACKDWREILQSVKDTGLKFKFKQGLDERLLDDEKAEMLFSSHYLGRFTFAFDRLRDMPIIEEKMKIVLQHTEPTRCNWYVLCGFDWRPNPEARYQKPFWKEDIIGLMTRINFLLKNNTYPYVMRFEKYKEAPEPYRSMYINLARWCNQPQFMSKVTFEEYCHMEALRKKQAEMYDQFVRLHPDLRPLFQHIRGGK